MNAMAFTIGDTNMLNRSKIMDIATGKVSLSILCFGAALAIATSAYAKGGAYHHSEPHPVYPDRHKTDSWAPVVVYPPQHRHYHRPTYHPHYCRRSIRYL